jgi:hypothetical protein
LAFPNPAKDRLHFVVALSRAAEVKVDLFNLAGERVMTLSGSLPAGQSAMDANAGKLAPGIYVARVLANGEELARVKVAIIR